LRDQVEKLAKVFGWDGVEFGVFEGDAGDDVGQGARNVE
jgi:hypothetical protein